MQSHSRMSAKDFFAQKDEIVKACSKGSINDLELLATNWHHLADPFGDGCHSLFFQYLSVSSPPVETQNTLPLESLRAFWSLYALSQLWERREELRLHRYPLEILRTWPGIFTWSAFFLSPRVQPPRPANASIRRIISQAWAVLSRSKAASDLMQMTQGVKDIIAALWILEDGEDEDIPEEISSFLLMTLVSGEKCSNAADHIAKAAGGNLQLIAKSTLTRFKIEFKSSRFAIAKERFYCVAYFVLIAHFCAPTNSESHKAFLEQGAIAVCIKFLIRLGSAVNENYPAGTKIDQDSKQLLTIVSIFIRDSLEAMEGPSFVIQGIRAGLLTAFVECSPLYANLDDDEYRVVSEPVSRILPIYLTYTTVLHNVDRAFQKLGKTAQFISLRNTKAWDSFSSLALLTGERLAVLSHAKDHKKHGAMCNNLKCRKLDVQTNFRRCAGCCAARYCSKKCQIVHWKDRHRQECKTIAEQCAQPEDDDPISARDHNYIQTLNFRTACKSLSYLKRLAAKEYPHLPLEELVVHISYGKVPPTLTLDPRSRLLSNSPDLADWPKSTTFIFGMVPAGEAEYNIVMTPIDHGIWQYENTLSYGKDPNYQDRNPGRGVASDWIEQEAEEKRRAYCGL